MLRRSVVRTAKKPAKSQPRSCLLGVDRARREQLSSCQKVVRASQPLPEEIPYRGGSALEALASPLNLSYGTPSPMEVTLFQTKRVRIQNPLSTVHYPRTKYVSCCASTIHV